MANSDKLVVVTGVSRGLGKAMVAGFVAAGARVVGCARSPQAIQQLASHYGDPHRFDAVDVADDQAVSEWAQAVLQSHGAPDLLLNNAALINGNAPLWRVPPDEFAQLVDVNINGVFYVIRHFLPAMIERGEGVLVNFSSGWGRSVSPDVAPYCGTKWAIEGMTQALASELPDGLAAVPLNPGIIDTEMLQSCFGEHAGAYPSPATWAQRAVPFLLGLSAKDNGRSLTAP